MLISFVVLSYNCEKYITSCLESIKNQTVKFLKPEGYEVELIISDDASTDSTCEIVKRWKESNEIFFKNVLVSRANTNQGTCINYCNGVLKARGEYIRPFAADDIIPDHSIVDGFRLLEKYDIVYGLAVPYYTMIRNDLKMIQSIVKKNQCIAENDSKKSFNKLIRRNCYIPIVSAFIKKELLINPDVLTFIKEYRYCEDYPSLVKISEIREIKVKFVNEVFVIYRRTDNSVYLKVPELLRQDLIKIYRYNYNNTKNIINRIISRSFYRAIERGKLEPKKCINLLKYIHMFYYFKDKKKINSLSLLSIKQEIEYVDKLSGINNEQV